MDIEDLTKSQLLLLTILVNFVVSIATGVLTVSLLDQGPTTITQTVNRIVDHTIETVTTQVPSGGTENDGGPTTEELLTSAIAQSAARSVSLYRVGGEIPVATGVYFPLSRVVATVANDLPGHVLIAFSNGEKIEADRTSEDVSLKLYGFMPEAVLPEAPPAKLIPSTDIKQGQTVIAIALDGSAVTGIVARIAPEGVYADLPNIPNGAAIVNLSGGMVGVHAGGSFYLPTERIDALLTTLTPNP